MASRATSSLREREERVSNKRAMDSSAQRGLTTALDEDHDGELRVCRDVWAPYVHEETVLARSGSAEFVVGG